MPTANGQDTDLDPLVKRVRSYASKAMLCSAAGLFCCGLSAVVGIVLGLRTLSSARALALPVEIRNCWTAIGLGLCVILLYVFGLCALARMLSSFGSTWGTGRV